LEFIKFSSLDNTYRTNLLEKIQYEGKDGGVWVATEKIHGANFSFWCDGTEVKVASRTQFVDGTFFDCQAVINEYSQGVLETFNTFYKEGDVLVIYGELFGGNIQKEVEYGEKDFKGFDVAVNGTPLEKLKAFHVIRWAGISTVPVMGTGTFAECLALSNTFKSTLTPEGYEEENTSEGLVIEPVEPAWFNNGSRIYFKNKTESFSEKKRKQKENVIFELSDEESDLMNELLTYNTTQRVSNVISKIGAVSNKDFGRILGLTTQDLLEEFTKDTEKDPKVIAQDNWKQFLKLLQAEVGKTVREEFLKSLDND
jgi:Rnl2 family RNA ligase